MSRCRPTLQWSKYCALGLSGPYCSNDARTLRPHLTAGNANEPDAAEDGDSIPGTIEIICVFGNASHLSIDGTEINARGGMAFIAERFEIHPITDITFLTRLGDRREPFISINIMS